MTSWSWKNRRNFAACATTLDKPLPDQHKNASAGPGHRGHYQDSSMKSRRMCTILSTSHKSVISVHLIWSCRRMQVYTSLFTLIFHTCTMYFAIGVGRIIAEAKAAPTVIPFWHVGRWCCIFYCRYICRPLSVYLYTGMDDMLPNYAPYVPRLFKVHVRAHQV